MEPQKALPEVRQAEGCLVTAIRIPVRIVVLVLVVPVRMVWDALVVSGRFLTDTVFRPVGRGLLWLGRAVFVWPFVGLWRYVLVPVGKGLAWLGNVLLVVPAVWLYRHVLTPIGHGIVWTLRGTGAAISWVLRGLWAGIVWVARGIGAGAAWVGRGIGAVGAWVYAWLLTPVGHGIAWLTRYLVVVPAVWLYTWVLAPVGRAVAWCATGLWRGTVWCVKGVWWVLAAIVTGIGVALYWITRVLFVLPALGLWRYVLAPVGRFLAVVGREIGDALGHAWRVAGHLSRAVGRFLAKLFRWIFVEPVRWVYRTVLTPVGHAVRDALWRPAAQAARSVGRATRQALAAARDTARQARADFRRMLFGEPRKVEEVARREPGRQETRTLGSSTTVLTKD
ncbi:hypothetical protein [Streptomyces sp. enrichment culture]|uniref:hypothetical protein n=1 Tax=Streptomyces sp. enrichment culture TaxID=1795815 RepID=UPI003F543373